MKKYPRAFERYWSRVGLDDNVWEDTFKHVAYLGWCAGRRHERSVCEWILFERWDKQARDKPHERA